jgi:hypothetical protein
MALLSALHLKQHKAASGSLAGWRFYASHYLHDRTNVIGISGQAGAGPGRYTFSGYYDHNVDDLAVPCFVQTHARNELATITI